MFLQQITRGGSHSTMMYYLRTANRAAALPDDTSWFIGFRVAMDLGTEQPSPSRARQNSILLAGATETHQSRDHTRRLLNELTKVNQRKNDDDDAKNAKVSKTKEEQRKPIDLQTIQPPILRKFVNIPLPGTTEVRRMPDRITQLHCMCPIWLPCSDGIRHAMSDLGLTGKAVADLLPN